MVLKPIYLFLLISFSFLVYSFTLYLSPIPSPEVNQIANSSEAGKGKLVYQKYNCQSCHQLFNLGGYLGPDLTNCYSTPGKGEPIIRAMVQVGTPQMPAFKMEEEELQSLIIFLKEIDKTGSSDLRKFKPMSDGMISGPENE